MPDHSSHGRKKLAITQAIEKRVRELQAELKQNPEAFRANAAKAYESFTDEDRKTSKQLQLETLKTQAILEEWKENLQPTLEKLEEKRTSTTFRHAIEKELFLPADLATQKIDQLLQESKNELLETTVAQLYPIISADKKQNIQEKRRAALTFLSQTKPQLENFYQRFVEFTAYMEVAQTHKVTIYDSMSSWVDRQRTLSTIKKEQQQVLKQYRERLEHITKEMKQLHNEQDGLLGVYLDRDWNMSQAQKLFTNYQKQLQNLPKKEQASPTQQLSTFSTATRKFRDEEVKKQNEKNSAKSLTDIHIIAEAINKLLLRFFELPEDQKKQLLENAEAYHALEAESSHIKQQEQNILTHQKEA